MLLYNHYRGYCIIIASWWTELGIIWQLLCVQVNINIIDITTGACSFVMLFRIKVEGVHLFQLQLCHCQSHQHHHVCYVHDQFALDWSHIVYKYEAGGCIRRAARRTLAGIHGNAAAAKTSSVYRWRESAIDWLWNVERWSLLNSFCLLNICKVLVKFTYSPTKKLISNARATSSFIFAFRKRAWWVSECRVHRP